MKYLKATFKILYGALLTFSIHALVSSKPTASSTSPLTLSQSVVGSNNDDVSTQLYDPAKLTEAESGNSTFLPEYEEQETTSGSTPLVPGHISVTLRDADYYRSGAKQQYDHPAIFIREPNGVQYEATRSTSTDQTSKHPSFSTSSTNSQHHVTYSASPLASQPTIYNDNSDSSNTMSIRHEMTAKTTTDKCATEELTERLMTEQRKRRLQTKVMLELFKEVLSECRFYRLMYQQLRLLQDTLLQVKTSLSDEKKMLNPLKTSVTATALSSGDAAHTQSIVDEGGSNGLNKIPYRPMLRRPVTQYHQMNGYGYHAHPNYSNYWHSRLFNNN